MNENYNDNSNYSYSYSQAQQQESQPEPAETDKATETNDSVYTSNAMQQEQKQAYKWQPYEAPQKPKKEKKPSGFGLSLVKVSCMALAFGLIAGSSFRGAYYIADQMLPTQNAKQEIQQEQPIIQTAPAKPAIATPVSVITSSGDVSAMVEKVMPSIVSVTNESVKEVQSFWGQIYQQESTSRGSGFIIGKDEKSIYIATNNHVVDNSKAISITFCNDKVVQGTIKGTDSASDLAVIEVALADMDSETISDFSVASLGSSDDIKVGQLSIVIGNALGYGQSVTTGVISALNREIKLSDGKSHVVTNKLIQTEASVNQGNSGGPLLDDQGNVIGVVSAKIGATLVEGMGYAIPIDYAKAIFEELVSAEEVDEEHASYLGVYGQDITANTAVQYDMPAGLYVTRVVSDSAAEKAGIKKGDILTGFNDRTINSMESLQHYLKYVPAESTVKITYMTAESEYEESKTIEVKLGYKNKSY